MLKKLAMVTFAVALMVTPAFADSEPEFDAVGCDAANYFALGNDTLGRIIAHTDLTTLGYIPINTHSDWEIEAPLTAYAYSSNPAAVDANTRKSVEFFTTDAFINVDPCFDDYVSYKADTYNQFIYVWQIVLQKKPESDIDLNIVDCVLKNQSRSVWTGAAETGIVRSFTGQLMNYPQYNPTVAVYAFPGPKAQFSTPFPLFAYQMPSLGAVSLSGSGLPYISKAFFEEGLVLRMPDFTGLGGVSESPLYAGDMLRVVVRIPYGHPNDLYYGMDNVMLKYIGIVGTEYFTTASCE